MRSIMCFARMVSLLICSKIMPRNKWFNPILFHVGFRRCRSYKLQWRSFNSSIFRLWLRWALHTASTNHSPYLVKNNTHSETLVRSNFIVGLQAHGLTTPQKMWIRWEILWKIVLSFQSWHSSKSQIHLSFTLNTDGRIKFQLKKMCQAFNSFTYYDQRIHITSMHLNFNQFAHNDKFDHKKKINKPQDFFLTTIYVKHMPKHWELNSLTQRNYKNLKWVLDSWPHHVLYSSALAPVCRVDFHIRRI